MPVQVYLCAALCCERLISHPRSRTDWKAAKAHQKICKAVNNQTRFCIKAFCRSLIKKGLKRMELHLTRFELEWGEEKWEGGGRTRKDFPPGDRCHRDVT
jgi:hypothetical protein